MKPPPERRSAVALRYDEASRAAPRVVAKGEGVMAKRIKRRAQQAGVPVVERKPLARALYASTAVGSEIPVCAAMSAALHTSSGVRARCASSTVP